MPRSKGFRRKTRSLLKKGQRARGLSYVLIDYHIDDKVVINIDSSQVKGMPHRRFQGLVGTVKEIRSRSLVINVPVGNKIKKLIARLEHIKPHTLTPKNKK
jgi:large subunit ribosomal protein L21e|tara:strand:+ start:922 stop:1224 length:303 start_codon:yes stop_codon:yes gene_type:complete